MSCRIRQPSGSWAPHVSAWQHPVQCQKFADFKLLNRQISCHKMESPKRRNDALGALYFVSSSPVWTCCELPFKSCGCSTSNCHLIPSFARCAVLRHQGGLRSRHRQPAGRQAWRARATQEHRLLLIALCSCPGPSDLCVTARRCLNLCTGLVHLPTRVRARQLGPSASLLRDVCMRTRHHSLQLRTFSSAMSCSDAPA